MKEGQFLCEVGRRVRCWELRWVRKNRKDNRNVFLGEWAKCNVGWESKEAARKGKEKKRKKKENKGGMRDESCKGGKQVLQKRVRVV